MTTLSRRVLPGLPLSLGYSVFYLSVLVLIPLAACLVKAASLSPAEFWAVVWTERARAAYGLTFGAALAAALLNVVLGLIVAWSLVRYEFPLKRLIDSLVDPPGAPDRVHAGLRPRHRRVRLGGLHRRQPAVPDRNRPGADRRPARRIRLQRSDGDRGRAADRLVRPAGEHQPPGTLEPPP